MPFTVRYRNWDSSVGIVSDCRLDDWRSILGRYFSSSPSVQTSSDAHPASYPMDTEGPFMGLKCGRGVTLTAHLHLVLRLKMNPSYTSSSLWCLHDGSRTNFLFSTLQCDLRQWRAFVSVCKSFCRHCKNTNVINYKTA
jgi:hypothetical protein